MRERNAPSQRNHIHTYSNIYAINLTSCIAFVTVARLHSYSNIVPLSSLMVLGCCCFTYVLCLCCTTTFSCLSRLDYTFMDLYRIYNNTRKKIVSTRQVDFVRKCKKITKNGDTKQKTTEKAWVSTRACFPFTNTQRKSLHCCVVSRKVRSSTINSNATRHTAIATDHGPSV